MHFFLYTIGKPCSSQSKSNNLCCCRYIIIFLIPVFFSSNNVIPGYHFRLCLYPFVQFLYADSTYIYIHTFTVCSLLSVFPSQFINFILTVRSHYCCQCFCAIDLNRLWMDNDNERFILCEICHF